MYIMYIKTERNGDTHLDFVATRETREEVLAVGLGLVESTEQWEIAHVVQTGIGLGGTETE